MISAEHKIKRHIIIGMVGDDHPEIADLLIDEGSIDSEWSNAHEYEGIYSKYEIVDCVRDFRCTGEELSLIHI